MLGGCGRSEVDRVPQGGKESFGKLLEKAPGCNRQACPTGSSNRRLDALEAFLSGE